MKYLLFTVTAFVCAATVLFAGAGGSPLGGGLMDDFIQPYDDTLIELPGEKARKPSVSRSAQLVDDSRTDTWGVRDEDPAPDKSNKSTSSSASSTKSAGSRSSSAGGNSRSSSGSGNSRSSSGSSSRSSGGSSRSSSASSGSNASSPFAGSKSFTADGTYIPYSERYPEPEKEKSDSDFDRSTFDPNFNPFKNNYQYKDTNYQPNTTRPEFQETRRKIRDILGDEVPKVMVDSKVDELIHNNARSATLEAPTTPDRWTRAPNGWFCDYDDAMAKAQQTGKAVAVFFHSSDNDNSRKFKTERMENTKFKNKMRDRLLIVYLDYPDNADTSKDKRNRDQVQHNRRIAEQFHVSSYPTVIILNSSGTEIGRLNNNQRTIDSFVENADRIVPQREAKAKTKGSNGGFRAGGNIGFGEPGVPRSSN